MCKSIQQAGVLIACLFLLFSCSEGTSNDSGAGDSQAKPSPDTPAQEVSVSPESLPAIKGNHTKIIRSLVFSPDEKYLATASDDRTIRIWEVASGMQKMVLEGSTSDILCLAWSPDGKRLYSGGNDFKVRVWDVWGGKQLAKYQKDYEGVSGIGIDKNGEHILSCTFYGEVRRRDAETGKLEDQIKGNFYGLSMAPDGERFALALDKGWIWICTVEPLETVRKWQGNWSQVSNLYWSPDGKRLAATGFDGATTVYDAASGEELIQHEDPFFCRGVTFRSSESVEIVRYSSDSEELIFYNRPGKSDHRMPAPFTVMEGVFNRDGNLFVAGGLSGEVCYIDPYEGEVLQTLSTGKE